jgi:trehalose/maltose hydrolase-like predicted phosphorylase
LTQPEVRGGDPDAGLRLPDFAQAEAGSGAAWALREDNYEPALEREVESRFFVGNGFLGIRGSLELPGEASLPRTYVAGLFDLHPGPPPTSALVPAPDAFALRLRVDGRGVDIDEGRLKRHGRLLDYRNGTLHGITEQGLGDGQALALDALRFASMAEPNLAVQVLRLRLGREARVDIEFPAPVAPESEGRDAMRTSDGKWWLAWCRARLLSDSARAWREARDEGAVIEGALKFSVVQLTAYGLARSLVEARADAENALAGARERGPEAIYEAHRQVWQKRWDASDVVVEGDDVAQQALRFAVYQLNSAVDPREGGPSVGARGLTGDAYIGHVFWDTEVFMLPFYIYTWPEAARDLLGYRYRTLPAAREKARQLGYRGALFAWESADTGQEVTPPYVLSPTGEVIAIRNGDMEHHVSAAVAYGTWQYWTATQDEEFLLTEGAEILLETARFWASRARREADGFYHIRHVIGPDEYHEDVDDNAYTNAMARWNIERGLETASLLAERHPEHWSDLSGKLGIDDAELAAWRSVADGIFLNRDPATGVPEQFAGYFSLEYVDLSRYEDRTAPMDMILGRERTRRSQVVKQADVLMLPALLPGAMPWAVQERAFDYYEPRTGHGSSLSPPMHALVAARMGRLETAERFFRETAAIDLNDSMGNSSGGIHMASLGGLWQAAVFGFGGMSIKDDKLAFEPRLPRGWSAMSFPVCWRGRRLRVRINRDERCVRVRFDEGEPFDIRINGSSHRVEAGEEAVLPLPKAEKRRRDDE